MIAEMIALRDAVPEDIPFLYGLYEDTRRHEVGAWGWPPEQQQWFLRMQFDAQRTSYRANFPDATDQIVVCDGMPTGRILTRQETMSMRLIDIALIEEKRQQGIGTHLLRGLIKECQRRDWSLHLQVAQNNPAIRLYGRLGFRQTGGDPMYLLMEWTPRASGKDSVC